MTDHGTSSTAPALLEIQSVSRRYPNRAATPRTDKRNAGVQACRDVSLTVQEHQFVALVGESGSGKSTLCRLALGLERPDEGHVYLHGHDLTRIRARPLRRLRRDVQAIFQDPLASLNPRWNAAQSIQYPLRVHGLCGWASYDDAVRTLLGQVGLSPEMSGRYPHELSGGQRQRVCIARALATKPRLVIADEAISGLDVTTQLEILALLMDLKQRLGVGFLFVTHDLRTVKRVADIVAVMWKGEMVETGPTAQVFERPSSDYAKSLIGSLLAPRYELHPVSKERT